MKNKNGTVSKRWLNKMFAKYSYDWDSDTGEEVIALREDWYDAEFNDSDKYIGPCLRIPTKELKEKLGKDCPMDVESEYLFEQAEKLFKEWHKDVWPKGLDAKIAKIKMKLVTEKLEMMQIDDEGMCECWKLEFNNGEKIRISRRFWTKVWENDDVLRKLIDSQKDVRIYDFNLDAALRKWF